HAARDDPRPSRSAEDARTRGVGNRRPGIPPPARAGQRLGDDDRVGRTRWLLVGDDAPPSVGPRLAWFRAAQELDMRELDIGLGTAGLTTTEMVLNIGPQHPATHGVLRLRITADGERIVAAEPIVGYMHRGAEKLFEVRDYRQIMVLANRHDWLSAFSNEIGVALTVEHMLGMEVPERATWTRTLLAELN